jgi:hypothetical protein
MDAKVRACLKINSQKGYSLKRITVNYHGRPIMYNGSLEIIAHGILRWSQQKPMMGY